MEAIIAAAAAGLTPVGQVAVVGVVVVGVVGRVITSAARCHDADQTVRRDSCHDADQTVRRHTNPRVLLPTA